MFKPMWCVSAARLPPVERRWSPRGLSAADSHRLQGRQETDVLGSDRGVMTGKLWKSSGVCTASLPPSARAAPFPEPGKMRQNVAHGCSRPNKVYIGRAISLGA